MTNGWNDIANSDCIIAIGGNPAENHPASFGHIMKAKDKGAKLISIDPRFTRTSAKADIYAKMRSGTDVAFIGGMIKYILDDMEANPNNYNMVYVREYTNAAFLVNPNYKFTDGLFSGYDEATRSYNKASWQYQVDENGIPKMDKTLKDPNCVFQLLKKHYARYDVDTVGKITGTPKDTYLEVCKTYAATGKTGKAGTILYAMGATQHTNGSQVCRSYCVLQLLLANIGVAGGGVLACRGESNVQGSTDYGLLYHILPGYVKAPTNKDENSLEKYLKRITPTQSDPKSVNWWQHTPKYVVSMLKSWYGDAATKENDFGFGYLPKNSGDCSWLTLFEAMYAGDIKGLMCWGMNPAVGGPNVNMERKALDNLDWLVAADLWETETADFWKRPGVDTT
jgi:formate dehydrogenase major subunit